MDENTKIFPGGAVTPIREVWAERTAGPIHIMGPGTVGDFMIIKQSPMCWLEDKILVKIGHPLYRTFPVGTSSRCPGTMAGLYRGRMSCDSWAPWREATRWGRSRHRSTWPCARPTTVLRRHGHCQPLLILLKTPVKYDSLRLCLAITLWTATREGGIKPILWIILWLVT